jgi:hypothetical protein
MSTSRICASGFMPEKWADLGWRRDLFPAAMVGYFEGIDSERGIAWRASDSLSIRSFVRIALDESVPDHSTISRTRRWMDVEYTIPKLRAGQHVTGQPRAIAVRHGHRLLSGRWSGVIHS